LRYLLVDRILRIEINRNIVAIKNVALSEDVFTDHFFGHPIMPGALLIESLAQTGTALIELSQHMKYKALLIMVQNAKFRAQVRPGDRLRIEATITSMEKATIRIEGSIYVDQKLVMTSGLVYGLSNADEVYVPASRPLVQTLYNIWTADAEMIGFDSIPEFPHA
jgi:3-hydroxyacyl-[acyl-carrier-protein] dehydratase